MTIHRITTTPETAIPDGRYDASSVSSADLSVTTTLVPVPPIELPKFDPSTFLFNLVCMLVCWILGIIGLSQSSLLTIVFGGIFTGIAVMFAMRVGGAALAKKLIDERGEAVAKAAADAQAETFMAGPPR